MSSSSLDGSGDGCGYVPDPTDYPPKAALQLQNYVKGLVWPILAGLTEIFLTSFVWLALPQGKQQPLAWARAQSCSAINFSLSHQALERLLPSHQLKIISLILSSSG